MGSRTVRLDNDTEESLARLTRMARLSISEVLKQGGNSFETKVMNEPVRKPYDIYKRLDLGRGGYTRVESRNARPGVVAAIRKKHGK